MDELPASSPHEKQEAHLVAPSPPLLKGFEAWGHPLPAAKARWYVDNHQFWLKMRIVQYKMKLMYLCLSQWTSCESSRSQCSHFSSP